MLSNTNNYKVTSSGLTDFCCFWLALHFCCWFPKRPSRSILRVLAPSPTMAGFAGHGMVYVDFWWLLGNFKDILRFSCPPGWGTAFCVLKVPHKTGPRGNKKLEFLVCPCFQTTPRPSKDNPWLLVMNDHAWCMMTHDGSWSMMHDDARSLMIHNGSWSSLMHDSWSWVMHDHS